MTDADPMSRAPSPWRWWVCSLLLLASAINYLDRMALNLTSVRIKAAFGITDEWYGLLESVFTVGFGIGTLTAGWLVDRVGVRWVYPAAVLGWSAFGVLTGFAPGYWFLFACRFGLGVFEAGNWPCGIRTVRQVMPPAERTLGNAFFQNGTAIGALLTPGIVLLCIQWAGPDNANAWQLPFRVIGLIGLAWVALWLLTVPTRVVEPESTNAVGTADATPFSAVLADRRFWILVVVVIAVNTSWHTFRVWLPLFLQKQHGYTEAEMAATNTAYYLVADVGVWVIGFGSLALTRIGLTTHGSRILSFGVCTALVLGGLAFPYLGRGPAMTALLLAFGFGAYGMFPAYFALSQELSGRHQGKVTGTLGAINSLYLTGMYWTEGRLADVLNAGAGPADPRRYDHILSVAGVPALIALLTLLLFWPREAKSSPQSG